MKNTTTTYNGQVSEPKTTYVLQLEAENAALRKWSKAWKRTAKLHRGFYQIMVEKAGEWQGKCFKSERENAALRQRVEELEANKHFLTVQLDQWKAGYAECNRFNAERENILLAKIAELEAQLDLPTSRSVGAGAGYHVIGRKDTETR